MVTITGMVLSVCLISPLAARSRQVIPDPDLPDTFAIGSAFTQPGRAASVPLWVAFDEPLSMLEVTVKSQDSQLTLDSVSFLLSTFPLASCHWIRLTSRAIAVVIAPPSGEFLPSNTAFVGRVYMTPNSGLSDKAILLDTVTYSENFLEHTTYFSDSTFRSFRPQVATGLFTVLPICCRGLRGNIDDSQDDGVDISDLTVLIGYLYLGNYTSLPCFAEADLDDPPDDLVDISDLSLLIDYLYIHPGEKPLPACP